MHSDWWSLTGRVERFKGIFKWNEKKGTSVKQNYVPVGDKKWAVGLIKSVIRTGDCRKLWGRICTYWCNSTQERKCKINTVISVCIYFREGKTRTGYVYDWGPLRENMPEDSLTWLLLTQKSQEAKLMTLCHDHIIVWFICTCFQI